PRRGCPSAARLPAAAAALEVVDHLVPHRLDLGLDVGLRGLGLVDRPAGPGLDVGLGRLGVLQGAPGLRLQLGADAGQLLLEAGDLAALGLEVLLPAAAVVAVAVVAVAAAAAMPGWPGEAPAAPPSPELAGALGLQPARHGPGPGGVEQRLVVGRLGV